MIEIYEEPFGQISDGTVASIFTIKNNNFKVKLSNFGASIVSLFVPDRYENILDVVLGYDDISSYEIDSNCFGGICGRFANRIKNGQFSLNGHNFQLQVNNGTNHLHGGNVGFHKKIWNYKALEDGIEFSILSPDGEENYPGNLKVSVAYTLLENENALKIQYKAVSDKDTILNLTNHSYFNLAGHNSGSIVDQNLKIHSTKYTELDESSCPNGIITTVFNTPFDFTDFHTIGERINTPNSQLKIGNGYDHNFVLDKISILPSICGIPIAAEAFDTDTGICMDVYTDKPGIQLYTANYIKSGTIGKNKTVYNKRYGFCLETQHFPDAINHSNFPSPVLKQSQEYLYTTILKFSIN